MDVVNFTPWSSLAGGILIGLCASLLMLFRGQVLGISGIVAGVLQSVPTDREWAWRFVFILGLLAGGLGVMWVAPETISAPSNRSFLALGAAGLVVGVGTRMGNGCTSGHGVCGLTRFSSRSLAAVLTFMLTGAIAAYFAPMVPAFVGG